MDTARDRGKLEKYLYDHPSGDKEVGGMAAGSRGGSHALVGALMRALVRAS